MKRTASSKTTRPARTRASDKTSVPAVQGAETASKLKPAAVIDIGSNAVRMAIAEIGDNGQIHVLENLSQEVDLGRDTFIKGSIERQTTEECVRVLKLYRRHLRQYGITHNSQVRVVATSAVREAENRLAFVDRVHIATGFVVDPIDEAEVNRITYLSMQPLLRAQSALWSAKTIVTEVGGGSTELLVVQGGNVTFSRTYRLGSIRLRETLDAYRAPTTKMRDMMASQIRIVVQQIVAHVPREESMELIALGGDVRQAASELLPKWKPDTLGKLPTAALEKFTDRMFNMSCGQLVQKEHLTYAEAETLAPALLAYVMLAKAFKLEHILVANVNLRDGLLKQMAAKEGWTEEFNSHVVRSALDMGRKYAFDEAHARHIAMLADQLFDALQEEHRLEPRHKLLLHIAAMLHEIGFFVNSASHHKHSMYLIINSDIFGLSRRELMLVGLVARYNRRSTPKPRHEGYATLDRGHRIAVAKMAAILRLADALDSSRSQRVREIKVQREADRLIVSVPRVEDLALEQLALDQKGPMFEEVFGMQVMLRRGPQ